jgi:hypothetical protein
MAPNQAGVLILISGKADIKPKLEEKKSLHIDKGNNS